MNLFQEVFRNSPQRVLAAVLVGLTCWITPVHGEERDFQKPRVVVGVFDDLMASNKSYNALWGRSLRQKLITALVKQHFPVVARANPEDWITECLIKSGCRRPASADYVIRASITAYQPGVATGTGKISIGGIGIGVGATEAHVGIDVTLIRVEDLIHVASESFDVRLKNTGISFRSILGEGAIGNAAEIDQATRQLIQRVANFAAIRIPSTPLAARN